MRKPYNKHYEKKAYFGEPYPGLVDFFKITQTDMLYWILDVVRVEMLCFWGELVTG